MFSIKFNNIRIMFQVIISYSIYLANATLERAAKPSIVLRTDGKRLKFICVAETTNGTVEFYGVCVSNCSVSLAARSAFT